MTVLTEAISDTVSITDNFSRRIVFSRAISDQVDLTARLRLVPKAFFTDSVGITSILRKTPTSAPSNTIGTSADLVVTGVFVQFDTWRPVPRPDNLLVLVCRTPLGEHDSYTGQTHLVLWTIYSDGTRERPEVLAPADNGYGWDSYAHPEWSPDGADVVVAAETSTEYELVVLDATGFGS